MVDQGLQDQSLPAGERAALAPHDRAVGELRARGLEGRRRARSRPPRWGQIRRRRGDAGRNAGRFAAFGFKEIAPAVAPACGFGREGALQPLRQILPVISPHDFVADALADFVDAGLQRRAPFRGRIAPPSISRNQIISASPRAAAITSSIAPRPPERARSSGSCPSGSSAKRRLFPGLRCGSARSAARPAAFCPARSPSKQRIGSSAIRQSSMS